MCVHAQTAHESVHTNLGILSEFLAIFKALLTKNEKNNWGHISVGFNVTTCFFYIFFPFQSGSGPKRPVKISLSALVAKICNFRKKCIKLKSFTKSSHNFFILCIFSYIANFCHQWSKTDFFCCFCPHLHKILTK